jgi:RecB family exonuclease
VQGFVDRIARRPDGVIEIHDYKTGRLPPQQKADSDRQLALYQIGVERQWPETRGVELIWHYVAFRETQRSLRTAEQLIQLRQQTIGLIRSIENTTQFEGRRSALCDWCEFKPDCPLWRHPDSVLALPPAQFKAEDGVRLADEYARTKYERDALELRLEQLKEQVIAFARQRNLRIIQGSGAQLSVRLNETGKFPGKREAERAALEALLKRAGKWEEISDLDTAALFDALEKANWPSELVAEVRKFATPFKHESVSLRRDAKGLGEETN